MATRGSRKFIELERLMKNGATLELAEGLPGIIVSAHGRELSKAFNNPTSWNIFRAQAAYLVRSRLDECRDKSIARNIAINLNSDDRGVGFFGAAHRIPGHLQKYGVHVTCFDEPYLKYAEQMAKLGAEYIVKSANKSEELDNVRNATRKNMYNYRL